MTNIEILHEIDQSLVAMIIDFSREVNFPELKIIYNEIKFIEKNINNPYSAIIKNNELNILFMSQSKILNNIKNELNNYNINSNDKANILKNNLIPNIKQYLNNYNKKTNFSSSPTGPGEAVPGVRGRSAGAALAVSAGLGHGCTRRLHRMRGRRTIE